MNRQRTTPASLGEWTIARLKQVRKLGNLTQREVGEGLGITAGAIGAIENGSDLRVSSLEKLLNFYGLHPAEFFAEAPKTGASGLPTEPQSGEPFESHARAAEHGEKRTPTVMAAKQRGQ